MTAIKKAEKLIDSQLLYEKQINQTGYSEKIRIVVIDIQTPENLAAIYRLADAAGCKNIVLVGDDNYYETKKFSRIARQTEKFLSIEKLTHQKFIENNEKYQPLIAVEITTESKSLFKVKLPESCSLVMGNERYGINEKILSVCEQSVHIPMYGNNGSMNVSHALAIALFEWRRQMS